MSSSIPEASTLAFPGDMMILNNLQKGRDEGKLNEALAWGYRLKGRGTQKPQESR